jgi:hypothetical protein
MSEKLKNEYSFCIKGGIEEGQESNTTKLDIDLDGDDIYIRSGLILAMKTSKEVSKLIIDAADYFRENGQNFEYNKKINKI